MFEIIRKSAPAHMFSFSAVDSGLWVGACVQLHSLRRTPERNGARGKIVANMSSGGRWGVRLLGQSKVLGLKPDNLALVSLALRSAPLFI